MSHCVSVELGLAIRSVFAFNRSVAERHEVVLKLHPLGEVSAVDEGVLALGTFYRLRNVAGGNHEGSLTVLEELRNFSRHLVGKSLRRLTV